MIIDRFSIQNPPAKVEQNPLLSALSYRIQVRTNFKVAFLNEFRKDARGALTAYVKAYELLLKAGGLGWVSSQSAMVR